jgi:uncharacterized protein YukE
VSDQQADMESLRHLVDSMQRLHDYCALLQQGATTFAYILPNEWQGPAMSAFIASFEQWNAGAGALTSSAGDLHERAHAIEATYQATIDALDQSWSKFQGEISG